jgi:hypothetical protein
MFIKLEKKIGVSLIANVFPGDFKKVEKLYSVLIN